MRGRTGRRARRGLAGPPRPAPPRPAPPRRPADATRPWPRRDELEALEARNAHNTVTSLREGMERIQSVRRSMELEALSTVTAARAAGTLAQESAEAARQDAAAALEKHAAVMKKVEGVLEGASTAERAALVHKAENHALGKEIALLRERLATALGRWREATRRLHDAEAEAAVRVAAVQRDADERVRRAEEAFNDLRRQLEDKVGHLERELAGEREAGEGARQELRQLQAELAGAEEAVAQAQSRAEAATEAVREREGALEEEFEARLAARAESLEAAAAERVAAERERLVGEADRVLGTVTASLAKAEEHRAAAEREMERRVSEVVEDNDRLRAKLAESEERSRELGKDSVREMAKDNFGDLSPEELTAAVAKKYSQVGELL